MAEKLTKTKLIDLVEEVLNEEAETQAVRRVQERIRNAIENFELPPDPEAFLKKLHNEIQNRFSPGDEVTRMDIADVVEDPDVWKTATNVNFRDFIDWVWNR